MDILKMECDFGGDWGSLLQEGTVGKAWNSNIIEFEPIKSMILEKFRVDFRGAEMFEGLFDVPKFCAPGDSFQLPVGALTMEKTV